MLSRVQLREIRRWMASHADEYVDFRTDTVNYTILAEVAADTFAEKHWPTCEDDYQATPVAGLFDLALIVGEAHERRLQAN